MSAHLCPSYRPESGARVLAVVTSSGALGYLSAPVELDAATAARLTAPGAEEARRRLRLVGSCLEAGCGQWTGNRCGVVDGVHAQLVAVSKATHLPPCSIRRDCRWFAQSGRSACELCASVRTEVVE
jgi:hypothetical protein